MKYIPSFLFLLLCLFLSSCKSGNFYDASGIFEADEIMVSAQADGEIMQLHIKEGMTLEKDAYVGYIDSTQLYLQKCLLLASVNATQSRKPDVKKQIAALQENLRKAKNEEARVKKLLAGDAATKKQLDDVQSQIRALQAQLNAQENSLDININSLNAESNVQEIQLAQVQNRLQKCQITNPVKGVVLNKYAHVGELTSIGRPLYKIADMTEITLRAYLSEEQLSRVKLGQIVEVYVEQGKQDTTYSGTLRWISDKAEFTPKTIQTKDERSNLVYAVKISVPNNGYLRIGMYADIRFK